MQPTERRLLVTEFGERSRLTCTRRPPLPMGARSVCGPHLRARLRPGTRQAAGGGLSRSLTHQTLHSKSHPHSSCEFSEVGDLVCVTTFGALSKASTQRGRSDRFPRWTEPQGGRHLLVRRSREASFAKAETPCKGKRPGCAQALPGTLSSQTHYVGQKTQTGRQTGWREEVCSPSTLGGFPSLGGNASGRTPHLSVEQVGGRLHDVHQNSHWAPAKLVSQRIVGVFGGWKPAAVGDVRFNLRNKDGELGRVRGKEGSRALTGLMGMTRVRTTRHSVL